MDTLQLKTIQQCQKGNLTEFGILYDLYIKKIYNFIFYKTLHRETAEDLTSQTFFKALNKIKTYNSKYNFSSWLYRIAQNTVIDHYRTNKITRDIEDVWDLSDKTDIPRDADAMLKVEKVKNHLKNLKGIQRDILILRLWENKSYQEIAEIVGKTETNCKMMYSRTIKKLRNNIIISLIIILSKILLP